jgi:L-alanine-DL-glutamate epimerase-like enolase superfamily enzyme
VQLTLHQRTLRLRNHFTIARNTRTEQQTTVVELSDGEGQTGYGEVSDNPYYTQASPVEVANVLNCVQGVLAKADPDSPTLLFDQLFQRLSEAGEVNYFALSALDMAAHDLAAKRAGKPLHEYWNFDWDEANIPVSNYTLSIDAPHEVLAKALQNPWPSYKVKLGGKNDLATIDLLRKNLPQTRLSVDANAAWEVDEALTTIKHLQERDIAFIEQPCARGAFAKTQAVRDALRNQTDKVFPPLVADEDCQTESDVAKCAKAYDIVNIKLSKCGGPTPALRMVKEAKALGLGVMFGCMIESSFAIGVLRHFSPAADFMDLDGALLLSNDLAKGIEFHQDGRPKKPEDMGSGVGWA